MTKSLARRKPRRKVRRGSRRPAFRAGRFQYWFDQLLDKTTDFDHVSQALPGVMDLRPVAFLDSPRNPVTRSGKSVSLAEPTEEDRLTPEICQTYTRGVLFLKLYGRVPTSRALMNFSPLPNWYCLKQKPSSSLARKITQLAMRSPERVISIWGRVPPNRCVFQTVTFTGKTRKRWRRGSTISNSSKWNPYCSDSYRLDRMKEHVELESQIDDPER